MDPTFIKRDLIDELIDDWKRERPDLDASAMEVIGRILQLGKLLEKRASNTLADYNIHYTDLDVLATLRRSGAPYQLSPSQLRKSVLVTSGAMTALLFRLEKMGLLSRKPDPEDGRKKLAVLTPSGKQLIDQAIETRFAEAGTAVGMFSKEEQEQFYRLLKKMVLVLERP